MAQANQIVTVLTYLPVEVNKTVNATIPNWMTVVSASLGLG